MNRRHHCAFAIIILAVMFFSCGCDSGLTRKSPSDALMAAYMTANEGKYSEAEKYLSSEVLSAWKGEMGALAGGMKGAWDKATHNGAIQKIEILNEEIRGEGAAVTYKIHFKDGQTRVDGEPMIQEDGHWKITVGCADGDYVKSELKAAVEKIVKGKDISIPYTQWLKNKGTENKWIDFFNEGKGKGLIEIRQAHGGKAIVGYFKDEFRKEFGYKSPKNPYDHYYYLTAGSYHIDIIKYRLKPDRRGEGCNAMVDYEGSLVPNRVGELLLKHGLIKGGGKETGSFTLKRDRNGDWAECAMFF